MEPTASSTTDTKAEICGICRLEDNEEPLVTLPCTHMFHSHCIRSWLPLAKPKPHCPYCRNTLVYSCGHRVDSRMLKPGAVMLPNVLAEGCDPCGFAGKMRDYYATVRLSAEVYILMSEAWPEESNILVVHRPESQSRRSNFLKSAWSHVQKLNTEIGGVVDFAYQWHNLPKSDYRKTEETPDVEKLKALEHLKSAVQAAIAYSDELLTSVPDWVPKRFSPSQFPDLYQSLHSLTLSFGFKDPLNLALHSEDKLNHIVESDEDNEEEEEDEEYPSDEYGLYWARGYYDPQYDAFISEDNGQFTW